MHIRHPHRLFRQKNLAFGAAILLVLCALTACHATDSHSLADLPPFDEAAYVVLQDNVPAFTEAEITTTDFESYSDLDIRGRAGVAMACIGQDIMPTEERESISSVTPSGWQSVEYDIVSGNYLYNRCHLIGFQLTGENANEENLITGTRFLNVDGMLPFEDQVADYIDETNHHVMYRATPIYEGNNLVASGVVLEAYSVEDAGAGVSFHVYLYNSQPGVTIDYSDGDSALTSEAEADNAQTPAQAPVPETEVTPEVAPEAPPLPGVPPQPETGDATSPTAAPTLLLHSLTSPIAQGDTATLGIVGSPGVTYEITVHYASGPSGAAGLAPQTSDAGGMVTWTWEIGSRTAPGHYPVTISGDDGSRYETTIVVVANE